MTVLRVCLVGLLAGGRSGVPRYAAKLATALDTVSPEFPDLSLVLLTTHAGARTTNPRTIELELVGRPFAKATAGPQRIIAEQLAASSARADLLHFFDLSGPLLALRRPFVATVHDAAIRHGFQRTRLVLHKRLLAARAIRHAKAIVAVSAFASDEAVSRFGAQASRIHVLRSGPGFVSPGRGGAGAPDDGPYVLYVGNLSAHKNLPFLVRAFTEADLDARLLLVGTRGEQFEEVRRAVESSPERRRIEVRRDVNDDELDRLYRTAAMVVLPSRYEGFGFTALEAMARGCPVLASDIPALREISGDGAWLLPADDRGAWAAAMRRVLADSPLREDLRRRGELTVGRYSWEKTARGICRLFLGVGDAARRS